MPIVKVWSEGKGEFVKLKVTEKQARAAAAFIQEWRDGEFFCSFVWHELFTEEQNEEVDTGTASFVAAFLPAGLGVTQHGHDDFAIEDAESDHEEEDEDEEDGV